MTTTRRGGYSVEANSRQLEPGIKGSRTSTFHSGPVWPSGKALGW